MEVVSGDNWTTGAISRAKLQSNHHHQQTNIQFFTGRMTFLSPNHDASTPNWNMSVNEIMHTKGCWVKERQSITVPDLSGWQMFLELLYLHQCLYRIWSKVHPGPSDYNRAKVFYPNDNATHTALKLCRFIPEQNKALCIPRLVHKYTLKYNAAKYLLLEEIC